MSRHTRAGDPKGLISIQSESYPFQSIKKNTTMKHFILIHGAWEESRIWDEVTPVLEAQGHTVTALDLPGHGTNHQPLSEVSMASYVRYLVDTIESLDHPVVLVGHSMAGSVISQVAEQIPAHIERLIYVAAFLLEDGSSVLEAMQSDEEGQLLPRIAFSADQSFATVPEKALLEVGFHDVNERTIRRVLPRMIEKQATEPFMAKVALSQLNFGSVPKSYVRTTIDRVTSPSLQDRLIANWQVDQVINLESGHFPAFSLPKELAESLAELALFNERELASV
jgi:pimeloyl-ACP methyl ester carboxylesterase